MCKLVLCRDAAQISEEIIMKITHFATMFILFTGFSSLNVAAAAPFNDKSLDVTSQRGRGPATPVRYNTALYNAAMANPRREGRIFRVSSAYNKRNGDFRADQRIGRMPVSFSRFACGIVTPRAFTDRNEAIKVC
jgi:hypothetical protein